MTDYVSAVKPEGIQIVGGGRFQITDEIGNGHRYECVLVRMLYSRFYVLI